MGPVFTGLLLRQYGRPGYIILPLLAATAFLSGWQWLTHQHHKASSEQLAVSSEQTGSVASHLAFNPRLHAALLGVIIMIGSTVSIAAINFAPKLFTELGYNPAYVGWLSGLFMLGSAFGGVVGGSLADRIGGKWVILLGTLAVILPVYAYIPAAGTARFALLLLAGFFSGMPHSILILRVQSLLPGRRALASGLALGFMFFSSSVGSYVLGIVADNVGLGTALQGTAVLPLLAFAAALFLPRQRMEST